MASYNEAVADAFDFGEAILDNSPTLAEAFTLADTLSLQANYYPSLADAFTLDETISPLFIYAMKVNEAFTLSDSVDEDASLYDSLAENFTLSEVISVVGDDQLLLADAFALAKVISVVGDDQLSLAEAFDLGEAISASLSFDELIENDITLSETLTVLTALYSTVTDAFTLADALLVVGDEQVSLTENITLSEALSLQANYYPSLADAFTLDDDAPIASSGYFKSLADAFTMADGTPDAAVGKLDEMNERRSALQCVPGVNVYPVPSGIVNKKNKEHVSWLYSGISPAASTSPSLAETFTLSEAITVLTALYNLIADDLTLADTISVVGDDQLSLSDAFTLADALSVFGDAQLLLEEAFTLSEVILDNTPQLADAFTLDDTTTTTSTFDELIDNAITLSEVILDNTPQLADAFTLADALDVFLRAYNTAIDAFTLADSPSNFISDYYISDMVHFFGLIMNEANQADEEPLEYTKLMVVKFLNRAQDFVISLLDRKALRDLDIEVTSQALDSDGKFDNTTLTYPIYQDSIGIDGIRLTSGAFCRKMSYSEYKGRVSANETFSTTEPKYYVRGDYIYVKPALDGDGNTQTIDIYYMKYAPNMAQTFDYNTEDEYTDCVFTNSKLRNAIVEIAVYYGYKFGNRLEMANMAFARGVSTINDINRTFAGVK